MLEPYLNAGYTAFWVITSENKRAIRELSKNLGEGRKVACWNCADGLIFDDESRNEPDMVNPLDALEWLYSAPEDTVLFLENIHDKLREKMVLKQRIINGVETWKGSGKSIVHITPCSEIPVEIDKIFRVMDFELPSKEQLRSVLEQVVEDNKEQKVKMPKNIDDVLEASLGLTEVESENAMALTLATAGKHFDIHMILEQKAQIIKKNSSLDFGVYQERFKDIGGLDNLKVFCSKTVKSKLSKGVLLLGVPGTGKSMFAKALGNEMNLPTLFLDMGSIFGRYIGESEAKIRAVIQIVKQMRPCILFIDEMEKGLAGSQSSGKVDAGVTSRVVGEFLTFMQDKPEGIYIIATCNDISGLPAPMLRAERWDAIFFVDLPTSQERTVILDIYKKVFKIKDSIIDTEIENWTGAEIKSLCRISKMMGIPLTSAKKFIIPISKSRSNEIADLRNWAKTKTIPASTPIDNGEDTKRRKVRVRA